MSRIHRCIKVEPPSPLVKTLVSTEVHRWGRPWWRFISFVTATAVSTIAGCSQRRVAAPCSHLRSRRFSPSSSSHPAAAARRFPSDIRSCPPLRLAPGVATVPFRWTGGALCVHILTGFACIGSLRLHSLVLYSRELADTESRSCLARNTDDCVDRCARPCRRW